MEKETEPMSDQFATTIAASNTSSTSSDAQPAETADAIFEPMAIEIGSNLQEFMIVTDPEIAQILNELASRVTLLF